MISQFSSFKLKAVDAFGREANEYLTERTGRMPNSEYLVKALIFNLARRKRFELQHEVVKFAIAGETECQACVEHTFSRGNKFASMVFLQTVKELFGTDSGPLGEGALQVIRRRIQVLGQYGQFGFNPGVFCCKVACMLFQNLNCFRNEFVLLVGFKLCHGNVLNGYSLCQCGSYCLLGQSVSCANLNLGAQWESKFTHKLHGFLQVLFYFLWVLFDL